MLGRRTPIAVQVLLTEMSLNCTLHPSDKGEQPITPALNFVCDSS